MIVDHAPRARPPEAYAIAAAPGCDRPRSRAPGARCPVCACSVAVVGPRCLRCRTPHHADCWRYNGGCGIYACQSALRQGDGLARAERDEVASSRGALGFVALLVALAAMRALLAGATLP